MVLQVNQTLREYLHNGFDIVRSKGVDVQVSGCVSPDNVESLINIAEQFTIKRIQNFLVKQMIERGSL